MVWARFPSSSVSRLDQELRRSRSPISLQGPVTTARTLSPGSRPWGRSSQGASPEPIAARAVSRAGYRGRCHPGQVARRSGTIRFVPPFTGSR